MTHGWEEFKKKKTGRKRGRVEGRGLGQAEKLLGFSTAVVIITSIVV